MLTTCRYCNSIHDSSYECEKKPKPEYKKNCTYIDRFRSSRAWRKKAEAIKRRDKYLCVYSLSKGIVETHDLEVHHIVPIKEDWNKRLDDSNLITLTRLVHEQAEDGTISREELLKVIFPRHDENLKEKN